jgi:hypothetical protein
LDGNADEDEEEDVEHKYSVDSFAWGASRFVRRMYGDLKLIVLLFFGTYVGNWTRFIK